MIKTFFSILAVGCLLAVILLIGNEGIKRQERVECKQWEQDSRQFVGWYATDWQVEQCLIFGVVLE